MASYPYQAVIFDCDGVLVDTEKLSNQAWQENLAPQGLHLSHQELHHHFTGYTTEANMEKAEELLGRPLPEGFLSKVRDHFWRHVNQHLPLIPGVEQALEAIPVPKATATNAHRRELDLKLNKSKLGRFFLHSVCVDEVQKPKPAPEIYLRAASLLKVEPSACAVVEDSPAGIQAAAAAGMRVYGFCRDMEAEKQVRAGAHFTFDDMRELPALLLAQETYV